MHLHHNVLVVHLHHNGFGSRNSRQQGVTRLRHQKDELLIKTVPGKGLYVTAPGERS